MKTIKYILLSSFLLSGSIMGEDIFTIKDNVNAHNAIAVPLVRVAFPENLTINIETQPLLSGSFDKRYEYTSVGELTIRLWSGVKKKVPIRLYWSMKITLNNHEKESINIVDLKVESIRSSNIMIREDVFTIDKPPIISMVKPGIQPTWTVVPGWNPIITSRKEFFIDYDLNEWKKIFEKEYETKKPKDDTLMEIENILKKSERDLNNLPKLNHEIMPKYDTEDNIDSNELKDNIFKRK